MGMLEPNLPTDIPHVFISGVSGLGLQQLKDLLWKELNSESNRLDSTWKTEHLVHRSKDAGELHNELVAAGADFEFDFDEPSDDDPEDYDDLDEVEVELD